MIKEFASSQENIMTVEQITNAANKKLGDMSADPALLDEYFDKAYAGMDQNAESKPTSGEMVSAIIGVLIKELSPNFNMPAPDSREFEMRFKKVDPSNIRIKVLDLTVKKGFKNRNYTPAEDSSKPIEKANEAPSPVEKPSEEGYFQKMAKKHFPDGTTSHAEYSHPEYNKDEDE